MMDKERQTIEREKIKNECIALSKENKHLVVELPTGSGKAYIVIKCIEQSSSSQKWIICVPETAQISNFENEFIKFGGLKLLKQKVEKIICYPSLKSYENSSYSIILNECHHLSEERLRIAKTIKFDQIISDSATISKDVEDRLYDLCPYYKYSKTMQEVIELGILPEPEIICVGIELNLLQQKEYDKISKSLEYWKDQFEIEGGRWREVKFLNKGSERKRLMSSFKTEKAKEIIESFGEERAIIFCGSINQAKELGDHLSIHSENSTAVNREIINDYNKGHTNSIYTNKMITEGQNLHDTSKGLIIQVDSGILTSCQKIGRVLRSEEPIIYILYIKNTQDEKYITNFIKETKTKIIYE